MQEGADDGGVKAAGGAKEHAFAGGFFGDGGAVGALGGEDVVDVGDGEDASAEGDFFAAQSGRVAAAVPSFVVVEDGFDVEGVDVAADEDARADDGVTFDGAAFFVGEGVGFEEDVVANPGFAEVVDEGGEGEVAGVTPAPTECTCQALGVGCDSAGVFICDDVSFLDAVGEREQDLPIGVLSFSLRGVPSGVLSLLDGFIEMICFHSMLRLGYPSSCLQKCLRFRFVFLR